MAELHGAPERSVLSAPMMLASAIGASTSRVKIGIAVQVLPLSHPLRLGGPRFVRSSCFGPVTLLHPC